MVLSIVGSHLYTKIIHSLHLKYLFNSKHPRSFNEKIVHRMLYDFKNSHIILSNKCKANSYVKEKIGEHVLNRTYFIGDDADIIKYNELPNRFIVKFTNHENIKEIIVNNKDNYSFQELKKDINQKINAKKYGIQENWITMAENTNGFIIEQLHEDSVYTIPINYKFFIFSGKCEVIQVNLSHNKNSPFLMTKAWRPYHKNINQAIPFEKPKFLEEMISYAEKLSDSQDFVRVDLLCPNNAYIKFNKFSLAPGLGKYQPDNKDIDFYLGKKWNMFCLYDPTEL